MKDARKAICGAERALNVIFDILMLLIFVATVIMDKRANVPLPNTVKQPNVLFYAVALVLLLVMYRAFYPLRDGMRCGEGEGPRGMDSRKYYGALAILFLVVAVLQFQVSRWFPLGEEMYRNSDFGKVSKCAWDIAHGGSFEGHSYFLISPNNANFTIILSFVYRLFGNQREAIMVGALLTNVSVILASLAVFNVCQRGGVAFAVAVVGEILVALTMRAFWVYTDSYAIIFVALTLWVYSTKLRPEIKVPLMIFIIACGTFIKMSNAILLAALAINGLIKWLRNGHGRPNFKRVALYALSFIVLFGGMLALQKPIRGHFGFVPGKCPKGWQYMFMVGQNTRGVGTISGGGNNNARKQIIRKYRTREKVNQEFLRRAINSIKKRGVSGNLVFYMRKLTQAYNDGYFDNKQNEKMNKLAGSLWYDIYAREGKYYQYGAMLMQVLWDMVLLSMMLYCLGRVLAFIQKRRRPGQALCEEQQGAARDMLNFVKLVIIGVTLYQLCLEVRSKYLYMFLPAFLVAFGVTLHTVGLNVRAWRSRRRTQNNHA